MPWRMYEFTVSGHTKDKKMFMFGPLFATFVPALGLSTTVGVSNKETGNVEK